MDLFDNLVFGFSIALSLSNLFYCFCGVLLGTFIGVLPGIGPLVTIALLLPLTFGLPPTGSIIMLAGIYYGAAYGGSAAAILLNLPGESSAAVTCIDGYRMARQGRAGAALAIAALGSFFAGCVGTVLIALFSPPLTAIALKFGPAEYCSLILMAIVFAAILVKGSILKGVAMALLGIVAGLSGVDVNSGISRFTFGVPGLAEGIDFVVVAMGLFAFAEIIKNLESKEDRALIYAKITKLMPTRQDLKDSAGAILRGTAIGSFLGILPGAGQTIASFAAYSLEKSVSRTPSRFGNGAIQGVAAPESANNAAAQTAFIPTLSLGVPGSPTMALIIGALTIQGIVPGPQVLTRSPDLFWGLVASMWIGNLFLVILNLPLVGLWVGLLRIPYRWLCPLILMLSCVGVYSVHNSVVDIYLAGAFAVVGFLFSKLDCEPAPFILGFVLGPQLEENVRRAMLFSRGDPTIFVQSPISLFFLGVTLFLIVMMLSPRLRRRKEEAVAAED